PCRPIAEYHGSQNFSRRCLSPPNGLRISGDGGAAADVRCSRGGRGDTKNSLLLSRLEGISFSCFLVRPRVVLDRNSAFGAARELTVENDSRKLDIVQVPLSH